MRTGARASITTIILLVLLTPAAAGGSAESPATDPRAMQHGMGQGGAGMGQGMSHQGMMGQGTQSPRMRRHHMMGSEAMGLMHGRCVMSGGIGGRGATFVEGRIAFIKAELGISDAQKAAWDAFAAVVRRNIESMQGVHQAMMSRMEARTPVERFDAHIAMLEARLAVLKDVRQVVANLYMSLTDEQKRTADTILPVMGCLS